MSQSKSKVQTSKIETVSLVDHSLTPPQQRRKEHHDVSRAAPPALHQCCLCFLRYYGLYYGYIGRMSDYWQVEGGFLKSLPFELFLIKFSKYFSKYFQEKAWHNPVSPVIFPIRTTFTGTSACWVRLKIFSQTFSKIFSRRYCCGQWRRGDDVQTHQRRLWHQP